MLMIEKIIDNLKENVKKRIWIISDLQQSIPENARRCLTTAAEDYMSLSTQCNSIWYLGDAIEGRDLKHIAEMAQMQVDMLGSLNIPVRYVIGNHDFDYFKSLEPKPDKIVIPFYDYINKTENWKSIGSTNSFYFIEDIGNYSVIFLSDHAESSGSWFTTHGVIHGRAVDYPYGAEAYESLIKLISSMAKPVITVSHYAFSGGNRPSELQDRLLPLPGNVKVHFYGHAHIGDKQWAGKDCYRKIACIDNQSIPQINVSSLENRRGNAVRSVFLEIYNNNSLGIYFRNHSNKKWEEYFLINNIE